MPSRFEAVEEQQRKLPAMTAISGGEGCEVAVESVESSLGRWIFAQWSPTAASPLFSLIARIWYFDGAMTQSKERVFPNGASELIVMLDEPHRDGDDAMLAPFPAVCINGLRTRPAVVVAPPGRCRVLGITFAPMGAYIFLRSGMKDLVDVTIDLRAALGKASDELGERCLAAAQTYAWNERGNGIAAVKAAAGWTLKHIGDLQAERVMLSAAQAILNSRGVVSLDALGTALGLSRARFATRFRNRTGLTPKHFARIVRFDSALSLLGKTNDIARVAAELEYYDQAHMYRDFGEFAGMTPGAFLSGPRYPGSASLAES
ncbi:MAG TPA: AraC family transcriptional regulator [Candidatus Cybelea sp.]